MRITYRSPSIKIGNTRYTFTKNGVNTSQKIFGKLRLNTKSNGKRYLSYSCFGLRFRQDLQKLDYDKMSGFSLFLVNPFIFFKRIFCKKRQSQSSFSVKVYMIENKTLKQATSGTLFLENDKITVKADVTKSILYSDITDIHQEKGFVLVSSKNRKNPLILLVSEPNELIEEISKRV